MSFKYLHYQLIFKIALTKHFLYKYLINANRTQIALNNVTFLAMSAYISTFDRVQEIINDDHRESGRIPRTVDCELMHDLGMSLIKMRKK